MNQTEQLSTIRAVSFDLDDTFWDCAPAIIRAEQTLYSWLSENHPGITERYSAEQMPEMRARMYQTHPHLKTDVSMMRKAFLEQLLDGTDNGAKSAEEAFSIFYRARSEVSLYEGTHELLKSLQNTHKLAAITNGNADLHLIGLADYFDDIQRATLTNPPKPASDMFDACCSNLGINNAELLHVGDNPETDIVGGYLAGARTVWFNQSNEAWPEHLQGPDVAGSEFRGPDFVVSSLPELQKLLSATTR